MRDLSKLGKEEIIKLLNKKKVTFPKSADKNALLKLLAKKETPVKKGKTAKKARFAAKKGVLKKTAVPAGKKARKEKTAPPPALSQEHYIKDELEKFYPLPDYKALKGYDFKVPDSYDLHQLNLLVVDPYRLYAFWEIKKDVLRELTKKYSGRVIEPGRLFLRVFDVTGVLFNGSNARQMWEFRVSHFKGNWFVTVNKPDCLFTARLGFKDRKDNFIEVLASNTVKTPRDRMSDNIVQLWGEADIDKPLALAFKELVKEHVKYPSRMEFISSMPGSLPGSSEFIKHIKDS